VIESLVLRPVERPVLSLDERPKSIAAQETGSCSPDRFVIERPNRGLDGTREPVIESLA